MSNEPYCFVLMPFGVKKSPLGREINFDDIYENAIEPAVKAAGMAPIRADQEQLGGLIYKAMFERLLLCPFAVADMSTANANVFYELGIRHASKPYTTVLIHYKDEQLPFDTACFRSLPYGLKSDGTPENKDQLIESITEKLKGAIGQASSDSPLYQVVDWMRQPDCLDHQKTDLFRDKVEYSEQLKDRLAVARTQGLEAVEAIHEEIGPIGLVENGVLIDLFLSYRAIEAWTEMIELLQSMPEPLNQTVLVREQYALALNRASRRNEAEKVLTELIRERGASSETYGLLGRVRKNKWLDAKHSGNEIRARGLLDSAIDTYKTGFELDMRDPYPGINLLTLLEARSGTEPLKDQLLPVVRYAAVRSASRAEPDYWDHATFLELAIHENKFDEAHDHLARSLASVREIWEPKTTLDNLTIIRDAWAERSVDHTRLDRIMEILSNEISELEHAQART